MEFTQTRPDAIVTEIACTCNFAVIIDEPDRQIGISRQIRREWFRHMRDEHPYQYARISPGFALEYTHQQVEAAERRERNVEKFNIRAKKASKGVSQEHVSFPDTDDGITCEQCNGLNGAHYAGCNRAD